MTNGNNLQRFIEAQEGTYQKALAEVKNGRKQSHWMWYIFPQIQGLGYSETSKYYAIKDLQEAKVYLDHPILGSRLVSICEVLLQLKLDDANRVFGSPDDLKLKSCMTLFDALDIHPIFRAVLDKFFDGTRDEKTLEKIRSRK
jgi:uncharacterized protein (DUF1810 family)